MIPSRPCWSGAHHAAHLRRVRITITMAPIFGVPARPAPSPLTDRYPPRPCNEPRSLAVGAAARPPCMPTPRCTTPKSRHGVSSGRWPRSVATTMPGGRQRWVNVTWTPPPVTNRDGLDSRHPRRPLARRLFHRIEKPWVRWLGRRHSHPRPRPRRRKQHRRGCGARHRRPERCATGRRAGNHAPPPNRARYRPTQRTPFRASLPRPARTLLTLPLHTPTQRISPEPNGG